MIRTIDQRPNLDGFVKPGELVDMRAGADLSLQDRRIFNVLVENAWSQITEDVTHRIAIAKLRGPRHKGGERVADSIKALMTTLVELPATLDGEPAIFTTHLVGETTRFLDEDSAHAMLEYEFPKGMRKVIQDSRYWGRIKAHVMFSFTSKYALALYEAVCLRGNLRVNEQVFTVEAFRDLLGIEAGKYPAFPQLKQRVFDPAMLEVNSLSDFNIEIEPLRDGGMLRGKLTGFRLRWEKKSREEWAAVLDELMRSKIGRKARIRGTVETVAVSGLNRLG